VYPTAILIPPNLRLLFSEFLTAATQQCTQYVNYPQFDNASDLGPQEQHDIHELFSLDLYHLPNWILVFESGMIAKLIDLKCSLSAAL
jgi:hypothetical protein